MLATSVIVSAIHDDSIGSISTSPDTLNEKHDNQCGGTTNYLRCNKAINIANSENFILINAALKGAYMYEKLELMLMRRAKA